MSRKRTWLVPASAAIALLIGVGLGLWYGWEIDPVAYVDTDLAHLHPYYRDEAILMVSSAYALDGDLDAARTQLALLELPDPATAVADLAARAAARGAPALHLRALDGLARALASSAPPGDDPR
ncbi:MAG: hypothetical protein JXA09_17625 [Anaerolineae bacterium]|nr:hypothetical protein [Anaerolineae bacterium]